MLKFFYINEFAVISIYWVKKSRFTFNRYLYNIGGGETMSIGPLSEWVTAFAKIAAVCIALFLPVYDKKQEKRKKTRNMKAIFTFLIKKALEEKDTSNLESCFKISYLIIDSNDDKQIYSLVAACNWNSK